ncbi:MAG: choice-of-anchor Q domain-containing protein, partial [Bacteroidota bacterium]
MKSSSSGVLHAQKNTNSSLTNKFSISNCIFSKNSAGVEGQIGLVKGANINLSDCLIDTEDCEAAIAYDSFFSFNVVTCNQVTFDSNSPFIDELNNNFTLSPCSPAINAGNNHFASDLTTDLKGNPRIQDGQVDIGAYEAPPMNVEIAVVRNSCSGANNGRVLFQIENACAPYEVHWEREGISGSGAENLAAGDYQFTITDSRGRSQEQSASIVENPALEVIFSVQNASAADVLNGSITVENISGGAAPYQIFVYDLANEQFRNQDNLQVGSYQLIIK